MPMGTKTLQPEGEMIVFSDGRFNVDVAGFGAVSGRIDEGDLEALMDPMAEGTASGRASDPSRAQGGDRREDDERKRPMEEAEKPDFPDVDGDGDREESISKASKDKKAKEGGEKKKKSDKDLSKVPPQLRKHMKGKMNEAQIRRIIRKLVKEAVAKKAK